MGGRSARDVVTSRSAGGKARFVEGRLQQLSLPISLSICICCIVLRLVGSLFAILNNRKNYI